MKLKWLASSFVCSVLAFACGGGGGGGAGTPTQALQASVNQTCSIAHECRDSFPSDLGFAFEDLFENTEAECVSSFVVDSDAVEDSVDAGRVLYDSADAQACLDGIDALSCAQFWGDEESPDIVACDTSFTGTVADGGTCTIDLDCADDDSFCDEDTLVCGP